MRETFTGSFTQQEPIPEDAIEAAVRVMRSGRLHRYNTPPGETSETARLETAFAALTGARHALAVASGGYALRLALRAVGVGPGDAVLTNAFTLAPVPGAIAGLGARPVFVGTTPSLTIDMDDLAAAARETGATVLLLSHMRGHIADMNALTALCRDLGLTLVEDCAHTMGAAWNGTPSGRHGAVGCFSTQTYKHANSGEGGLVVTDDADLAAKMVLMSGSYMFHDRHGAGPDPETVARHLGDTPNLSGRMDEVRAAILTPQLATLDDRVRRWEERYRAVEDGLRGIPGLTVIERAAAEHYVGSSIQWRLDGWPGPAVQAVVDGCRARGVELKWFGAVAPAGFTSTYRHWTYAAARTMPATDRVLAGLLDMRLPLTFSVEDCRLLARIVGDETGAARTSALAAE